MDDQVENDALPVGTDLIDATQNAVIEAVTNVSELIEKTTAESTFSSRKTDEVFYKSSEFWVGMAFVLVLICILKPVFSIVKRLLIARQTKIASELKEVEALYDEAQELLAKYERRSLNATKEAEDLLKASKQNLEEEKNTKLSVLEKEAQKSKKETEQIIQTSILTAQNELKLLIGNKTAIIVENYLKQTLNSKKRSKLIDLSISNILKKL